MTRSLTKAAPAGATTPGRGLDPTPTHQGQDPCHRMPDWGGISRYDGDGSHALARLTADEQELTELAGPRVALAVLDPDDDTEAEISLSLAEARLLRDRLTALLNEAFAS